MASENGFGPNGLVILGIYRKSELTPAPLLGDSVVLRVLFMMFLLVNGMLGIAQARLNTEDLGRRVQKTAEEKQRQADRIRLLELKHLDEAERAELAMAAARRAMEKANRDISEIDRKLDDLRREQVEGLEKMVYFAFTSDEAGPALMEAPFLIREVPAFQEVLEASPWLSPILDELLEEYTGKKL